MALKMTYDNPAYEKDAELSIMGLGLVKNGSAVTLTEEQEETFLATVGVPLREYMTDDENVKLEGPGVSSAKGGDK